MASRCRAGTGHPTKTVPCYLLADSEPAFGAVQQAGPGTMLDGG